MRTRQMPQMYGASEFGQGNHLHKPAASWQGIAWCGTRLVRPVSADYGVPCRRCERSKRLAGH